MSPTDAATCIGCGRSRWTGDKYCASCGQAFDAEFISNTPLGVGDTGAQRPRVEFTLKEPPPEVELGGLGPDPVPAAAAPPNRYLVIGLSVVGLLMAIVLGVSILTSGSNSETAETASDSEDDPAATSIVRDTDPLPIGPLTATPVPTSTRTPTVVPTREPTRLPRPPVTPLASSATAHDEDQSMLLDGQLSGYVAFRSDTGFQVIDLTTGKDVLTTLGSKAEAALVSRFGAVRVSEEPALGLIYEPWDGSEPVPVVIPDGYNPTFIMDDEAGPLLMMIVNAFTFHGDNDVLFIAMHLPTGEQQEIRVEGGPRQQAIEFQIDPSGYRAAPLLLTAGSDIYRWQWNDGWLPMAEGHVVLPGADFTIVDVCTSPSDCERSLLSSTTGEVITQLSSDTFFQRQYASISPTGEYVSTIQFGGTAAQLTVLNTTTGVTEELESEIRGRNAPSNPLWIGETDLLIWGQGSVGFEHVDIETGVVTELDVDSGTVFAPVWLPELVGLPGDPQG